LLLLLFYSRYHRKSRNLCIDCTCPAVGSEVEMQGHLCEERLGLPHAKHRWFQSAPVDPLQDVAEHLSQDGGISVKIYVRKGKNIAQQL